MQRFRESVASQTPVCGLHTEQQHEKRVWADDEDGECALWLIHQTPWLLCGDHGVPVLNAWLGSVCAGHTTQRDDELWGSARKPKPTGSRSALCRWDPRRGGDRVKGPIENTGGAGGASANHQRLCVCVPVAHGARGRVMPRRPNTRTRATERWCMDEHGIVSLFGCVCGCVCLSRFSSNPGRPEWGTKRAKGPAAPTNMCTLEMSAQQRPVCV